MKTLKGITIEKQHLRRVAPRNRLTTAIFIGGLLSFLFGAWIVPWLWASGGWLLHHLPGAYENGSFPSLLGFLASPTLWLGLIWLAYYIVTYLHASSTLSPRDRMKWHAEEAREFHEEYGDDEWSFSYGP